MIPNYRIHIKLLITAILSCSILISVGCSRLDAQIHDDHDHESHEEHQGDEHKEGDGVQLSDQDVRDFGVKIETAGSMILHREIVLPGRVRLDQDRVAHVMPTIPGNVFDLKVREGEKVVSGQLLVVIHSRELAEAKAAYLDALEHLDLARKKYNRTTTLHLENISSVEALQQAEREQKSAEIEYRSTEQTLHALGLDDSKIQQLGSEQPGELSHLELRAPFDGVIISRSIVLGQRVDETTDAFVVADLSTVWVDADVYPRDLGIVRQGLGVKVLFGYGVPESFGKISFVGPIVGEQTRTALARTIVPNPDGLLRPGSFVSVKVQTEEVEVAVGIPKSALVQMEGIPHVFVLHEGGFEPIEIILGMENDSHVEVTEGLSAGDRFVTENAFILKAELEKESFGDGHAH
ncbi:efflux RND transporter periplasmic adaptor subunit [bacterium]|nr:efflux RND transporter periplasmic adaptor subunit [bacterium]